MSQPKTVTVKLSTPVTAGGKLVRELTFREPTVDDMLTAEAVGGGELRATVAMLASMAGVEMEVMKAVTRKDFQRIVSATAPLLSDGEDEEASPQADGETPDVASAA